MRASRHAARLGTLLAWAGGFLAGCASPPPDVAPLWSGERSAPAVQPIAGSELVAMESGTASFAADDGRRIVVHVSPTTEHGAEWAHAFGDDRIEYVRASDGGGVQLMAVLDHAERALTRFEPGLTLAPEALGVDEEIESTASMRVVDSVSGAVRFRGKATMVLRRLDDAVVAEAGAERTLHRTTISFRGALGLARVHDETVLWTDPDTGVVVRDEARTITVLGLRTRAVRVRWQRR